MRRLVVAASLALGALLSTGCATGGGVPSGLQPTVWRYLSVENQNYDPVILYGVFNGTNVGRLARVPGKQTTRVRVPASYLSPTRGFSVEVCFVDRQRCHRTQEYTGLVKVPKLIVFPTTRIAAELYGED